MNLLICIFLVSNQKIKIFLQFKKNKNTLRIINENIKQKFVKIGKLKEHVLMETRYLFIIFTFNNVFSFSVVLHMDIMNYKKKNI